MTTPAPPPRVLRLDLAYDGTDFFGWQIQPGIRTVQGVLARALGIILDEPVILFGAGRTDTGVHATGQVASLTTTRPIATAGLTRALNTMLPADVHVTRVTEAAPTFHARFSARRRTYRYRVVHGFGPFRRRYAWVRRRVPDVGSLNAAMAPWLGVHSFHAFTYGEAAAGDTRCRLVRAEWREARGRLVLVLTADRFLYRMVRTMVAILLQADRVGGLSAPVMARLLEADAVRPQVAAAPAAGLFLTRVDYPGTAG